jgi:hypothetical protein
MLVVVLSRLATIDGGSRLAVCARARDFLHFITPAVYSTMPAPCWALSGDFPRNLISEKITFAVLAFACVTILNLHKLYGISCHWQVASPAMHAV